jgi:two-component system cell cycle sensor histidine kinase/response regulator CckA
VRVGLYFVLATVVLIIPGLLLAERLLRRRLQESRLAVLETTMRAAVLGTEQRVAAAQRRVARFAGLLAAEPASADPALVREFDRLVRRDPDGAWRTRRELFNAGRQAGVYIPRPALVDAEFKSFLIRAKRVTETFGAGALDPPLADAWVQPSAGGQVIYVPDQPDLVWESAAAEDYSQTEWMTLAEPGRNPAGVPRWANPFHSIKTDAWFVSVVAPLLRGGRWAGSVGQDLALQELVDYSVQAPMEAGGGFLIVGRNGGIMLADTNTSRTRGRPSGLQLQDLTDREMRDTLAHLLATPTTATGMLRRSRTSTSYVLWTTLPSTGWLVASLIPENAVNAPLRGPLRAMRLSVLLGLGALSVASLLAITREIRRRRAIEDATRRSEERFMRLFQLSPDGVGVSRLQDGRLIEVNDSLLTICGYTREEMLGRTSTDLGIWALPEQRLEGLDRMRREGVIEHFPTVIRRKDGREVEVEVSARMVEVEGEPCLLSIISDVDEQRRLERQLTHAQKMEAIGRLAGGVAHDFNNIMTAVMGYAQIASDSLPPESEARDDLAQILRASSRASELTRQLLAFARKQITQPRPVDLDDLVRETRKLLERLLGADVALITDLGGPLPPLLIDPGQLEQVLLNLAVNARDAMPKGGSLTLRTARMGDEIALDVVDTGTGIPLEHQPHIFEPFFTTKEHGKGTGLGLATCYGIVRQAGGRIEVITAPDVGTTFRVILPAAPLGRLPEGIVPAARGEVGIASGTETILLAEDEPQVRELAVRMLGGLGYQLMVASNGREAFETAARQKGPIDLLVTDVVMPEIDGRELAARLRAERPGIRVLYISGYAENSAAIEQALREGDGFLPKPFTVGDLARRVREILDQEKN